MGDRLPLRDVVTSSAGQMWDERGGVAPGDRGVWPDLRLAGSPNGVRTRVSTLREHARTS
jgi:hypothetical protein